MSSKRTFSQARPPAIGFIDVTLEGYYQLDLPRPADAGDGWEPPTEWSENFRFLRHAPFSETGNLVASFSTNNEGKLQINQLNITRYLLRTAHPEDRGRLAALLDDQYRVLTTSQASDLAMFLVEEQTGKASTTSHT